LGCYSTGDSYYTLEHKFLFSHLYPRGVSSAVFSAQHSVLFITGLASPSTEFSETKAGLEGLTVWRVLSGTPYYKLVTDYEQLIAVSTVAVEKCLNILFISS